MPLVDYVTLEDATGEARDVLEDWDREQDKRSLILESMANHPPLVTGFFEFYAQTMRAGTLGRDLKELVACAVSQRNDCAYCTSSHRESFVEVFDFPREKVTAIAREDFSSLSEREAAAAEFGLAVAGDPHGISDAEIDALRETGFSTQEIVEIVGVVCCFMAANTYVDAMNVHPADRDQDLVEYLDTGG